MKTKYRKSVLLVKNWEVVRIHQNGVSDKKWNTVVQNVFLFGYHGVYSDDEETYKLCFNHDTRYPKWDEIKTLGGVI